METTDLRVSEQIQAIYDAWRKALGVVEKLDIDAAVAKHDAEIRSEYEEEREEDEESHHRPRMPSKTWELVDARRVQQLEGEREQIASDLLRCHATIAGAWEAIGNLVAKDGEGSLGEEIQAREKYWRAIARALDKMIRWANSCSESCPEKLDAVLVIDAARAAGLTWEKET